jgi:hypothetical protein
MLENDDALVGANSEVIIKLDEKFAVKFMELEDY